MPSRDRTDATAESLFRSHAPFVARFLFRLGVPAAELDDVVQEVFLVVHRRGDYVGARAKQGDVPGGDRPPCGVDGAASGCGAA